MTVQRSAPELAYKSALFRTLPNQKSSAISVSASSGTESNALSKHYGKTVWLVALGADVTVLRGSHTMTAGVGLVIADGTYEEFYVSPGDSSSDISHIASGAGSLYILFDTEGL